jgi:fatty acid desaturase
MFLLPNHFKKWGAVMAPLGLIVWTLGQIGFFDSLLLPDRTEMYYPYWPKVALLGVSFFSFFFGVYFMVFVKEKVEDEFIDRLRLLSFQRSALFQLLFMILAFVWMIVFGQEPAGDAGMMLFLIFLIGLFWLFYIINFNVSLYLMRKRANEEFS